MNKLAQFKIANLCNHHRKQSVGSNIVISRNAEWKADGVEIAQSIEKAVLLAQQSAVNEIFIIGGGCRDFF